jgi:dCMP deaminase
MLQVAAALARRSTCLKMGVGCVLTDSRGRILSTGYNGVHHSALHCNELVPSGRAGELTSALGERAMLDNYPNACPGAHAAAGADLCQAIHAEQNALTWCRDPDAVRTCYATVSPCMRCTKQLLGTGCARIVFLDEYALEGPQAASLWRGAGRVWNRLAY